MVQYVSLINIIHILLVCFSQMLPVWIIILLSIGSGSKFYHYSYIISLFLTNVACVNYNPSLVKLVSLIDIIHILFDCFSQMLPV